MTRRAGGLALVAKYGPDYMRRIAARGGKRTAERHGSAHMARIGRKGAQTLHELYRLEPTLLNNFALVHRATNQIVAFLAPVFLSAASARDQQDGIQ